MANGTLSVVVEGLRNDRGHLLVGVYDTPAGFPRDGKPAREAKVTIQHGRAKADFVDLQAGTYAVAVLHDEDDDGEMDTNWMRLPKEGFGISKLDRLKLSAPSFEESSFAFQGRDEVIDVKVHYVR